MGTIAAIGGGRYDNGEIYPILKHIVSLAEKPEPKVLYLPTAGFDYIIGDEIIADTFRQLDCVFATLFLTDPRLTPRDIEMKIMSADIIYAGGGNLKFLMDTWKNTKADIYLKNAYEKGIILSGYSSGAMCWFEKGWDDCGPDKSFMFVEGTGIIEGCFCPHFDSDNWHDFENIIKEQSFSGTAADNGAAVIYKDGKQYTLKGNDGGEIYFFDKDKNFKPEKISISPSDE